MEQFTLLIKLGNDAMQTPEDVANRLLAVANMLNYGMDRRSGEIIDLNGNKVGEWGFTK